VVGEIIQGAARRAASTSAPKRTTPHIRRLILFIAAPSHGQRRFNDSNEAKANIQKELFFFFLQRMTGWHCSLSPRNAF
jgi:hypothetical protein